VAMYKGMSTVWITCRDQPSFPGTHTGNRYTSYRSCHWIQPTSNHAISHEDNITTATACYAGYAPPGWAQKQKEEESHPLSQGRKTSSCCHCTLPRGVMTTANAIRILSRPVGPPNHISMRIVSRPVAHPPSGLIMRGKTCRFLGWGPD